MNNWQAKALCRGRTDIEWFPPAGGANQAKLNAARELCSVCPVSRACLADVLSRPAEAGIWAGTTENQRRGMHRRRDGQPRKRVAVCGTDSGYFRHLRQLRDTPCEECYEAHAHAERLRTARLRAAREDVAS